MPRSIRPRFESNNRQAYSRTDKEARLQLYFPMDFICPFSWPWITQPSGCRTVWTLETKSSHKICRTGEAGLWYANKTLVVVLCVLTPKKACTCSNNRCAWESSRVCRWCEGSKPHARCCQNSPCQVRMQISKKSLQIDYQSCLQSIADKSLFKNTQNKVNVFSSIIALLNYLNYLII